MENERLNNIIVTLHGEIENLKNVVKDLDKSDMIIRDLENKLHFYMNENEKLNKILVARSSYNYWSFFLILEKIRIFTSIFLLLLYLVTILLLYNFII